MSALSEACIQQLKVLTALMLQQVLPSCQTELGKMLLIMLTVVLSLCCCLC